MIEAASIFLRIDGRNLQAPASNVLRSGLRRREPAEWSSALWLASMRLKSA
jgi:hypothetical protein